MERQRREELTDLKTYLREYSLIGEKKKKSKIL